MPIEPVGTSTGTSTDEPSGATRRCWRCLQHFPVHAAGDEVARAAEWWVCDACHVSLFGRARSDDDGQ